VRVRLAYGQAGLDIEVDPGATTIVEPVHEPAVADPRGELRTALRRPVAGAPLRARTRSSGPAALSCVPPNAWTASLITAPTGRSWPPLRPRRPCFDSIRDRTRPVPDQWQVQIQAQIQATSRVVMHTSYLTDSELGAAHLEQTSDVSATVADALAAAGPGARLCVLPEGPQTIPYISPAQTKIIGHDD
jgi:hypothetical protein